jgi:integrase
MSLFKRGTGKVWNYRFKVRGQVYYGSTKETNIGKARQFEASRMTKIRETGHDPFAKAPLLSEFAPKFLKHIDKQAEATNLAPKTVLSYKNGCRLLTATDVWGMRLDQIGRAEASELSFPGSGSNANQALRTLRRLLSYAEECRILRAVPRIDLREEHGRDRILEPWMEALILEHASSVLRDVITIMLDCGMRPEEVGRMEWEHVRWNENTILVPHGKSFSARRFVGLTERMREVLSLRGSMGAQVPRVHHGGSCAGRASDLLSDASRDAGSIPARAIQSKYVFPSKSKSGHVQNFTATWARTIKRASKVRVIPPEIVLYSARHTFATNFLRAGGDIGQLCRLMGHSDIRTTQKYLHLVEAGSTAAIMNQHNNRKLRLVKSA